MNRFRNLLIEKEMTLPSIYRKAAFVRSDDTSYINTGFVIPEEGCIVEVSFKYVRTIFNQPGSGGGIWGSRYIYSPYQGASAVHYWDRISIIATLNNIYTHQKGTEPQLTTHVEYHHKMVLYKEDNTYFMQEHCVDGTTINTLSSATSYVYENQPIFLFRTNLSPKNETTAGGRGIASISNFKITAHDGTKLLDLIPCVRKTDNVPGMWDKVGKNFLTNAASAGGNLIVHE